MAYLLPLPLDMQMQIHTMAKQQSKIDKARLELLKELNRECSRYWNIYVYEEMIDDTSEEDPEIYYEMDDWGVIISRPAFEGRLSCGATDPRTRVWFARRR